MSFDHYILANPCPNCGEEDSEGAWKGARTGSTEWGHGYLCCSDKCGREFAESSKLFKLEIERLNAKKEYIELQILNLHKDLKRAIKKEKA